MPIFAIFLGLFLVFIAPGDALALSEYGLYCKENSDCIDCKDDVECLTCLNACYNKYGAADGALYGKDITKKLSCIRRQSKWCSAQCWDPDDPEEPTTKPMCHRKFLKINTIPKKKVKVLRRKSDEEEEEDD